MPGPDTELAHLNAAEQLGARIALAALRRDFQTIALLLDTAPDATARQSAAVALGALAELALTARPTNLTRTRDTLTRMEAGGLTRKDTTHAHR